MKLSQCWSTIRLPLVLLAIVLIPLSIYGIVQDIRSDFHTIQTQGDEYARSPGCSPRAENVDPALSPCTEAPMTVVDVQTHSESSKSYGSRTVYDLIVRDQWGVTQTYTHVYENFAASRRPGEQISAQYWRGHVEELTAGQDHYPVGYMPPQVQRNGAVIFVWLMALFGSFGVIRLVIQFWDYPNLPPFYRRSMFR
ncbi:hypothetical protein CCAX7_63560 [Capsulimonas corticalis]|uniref:Uncharacterized protein n=1 Tax=Capsulimonas corticalis TaxID=2219043 RepID=A0A402CX12_9BACT|nr:hypothetical protein [Capsulimonas corticalis]BDI34305.1 hypothetical protein CCAX7_63560 [Capsulimonas corticalis]